PAALGGGSRVSAVRAGGAARAVRSGLSCPAGILSVGAGVLTFLGNVDLLTVGEHPGQIHRIRGGVALQPACGLDGVRTRAPAASVTTEGCPTAPVTWTITSPEGGAEAVPPGPVPAVPSPPAAASSADPACCPASSSAPVAECCGAGRRRKKARTSTPSVAI